MAEDAAKLASLSTTAAACARCRLAETRTKVVFGMGSAASPLVFVGEGPGAQEDATGLPFVGRSCQLLDTLIEQELGVTRSALYIANIVKCRPPGNRNPLPDEVEACTPYLEGQLEAIAPALVVALGAVAGRFLIGPDLQITSARGKFFETRFGTVMPTFHPSYGLRQGGSAVTAMRADMVTAKLYLMEHGRWK